jgi:hypothetical protein
MKTKIEIIDETVAFYGEDINRRSVTKIDHSQKERCLYLGPNGKQCAFARVCIDTTNFREGDNAASHLDNDQLIIKPEYRGHDGSFWNEIQRLHDYTDYWSLENELSDMGKEEVKRLKLKYQ